MQKAAEPIPSVNPNRHCDRGRGRRIRILRCALVQTAVRSVTVEVLDVLAEHMAQMALSKDEQPVQALPAERSDPALTDGVGARRPDGGADDSDALGAKHLVERRGELGVAIPDQELDRAQVGSHCGPAGSPTPRSDWR